MMRVALRASGVAVIVGTLLMGVGIALIVSLGYVVGVYTALFLGALLTLLGLPGMYAHQAQAAGWLGLVGHALLTAGFLLVLIVGAEPLVYRGAHGLGESVTAFSLGISAIVGLLLTAIATPRARVYPRGAGLLLLVAGVLFFFSFIVAETLPPLLGQIGNILLALSLVASFVWVGVSLWRGEAPTTRET
jgi:hypothetical protein